MHKNSAAGSSDPDATCHSKSLHAPVKSESVYFLFQGEVLLRLMLLLLLRLRWWLMSLRSNSILLAILLDVLLGNRFFDWLYGIDLDSLPST
ncbi:hypothetical protein Lalb_Chr11g0071761 [Lupinus albus]|uniref:Uncharacterized protein n=1 Tax=Lupinus albus TaxID=3870 RepID=A0A6A4PS02_LUPAL|nr:hypothetical protein Lalb_Chr11g0071761 [Lupinus albus]